MVFDAVSRFFGQFGKGKNTITIPLPQLWFLIAIAAGAFVMMMDLGLDPYQHRVTAIALVTFVLWFSEALPLHITGLLMSFLLIVFTDLTSKVIFPLYFNNVVIILFGGLYLALLLNRYHVDQRLIGKILKRDHYNARLLLLVFMLITAFLSMWISNTASAAVMIPLMMTILAHNNMDDTQDSYAKASILGIAYAATLGGIASLVGTAPNALAAEAINALATTGNKTFGFVDWMMYGAPVTAILVFVAWIMVLLVYPPTKKTIQLPERERIDISKTRMILFIFLLTVAGWLSSKWTGIDPATVALLPIILGYVFGFFSLGDIKKIDWGILLLIGSGIVIGFALKDSGLAAIIAESIGTIVEGKPLFVVLWIISIMSVLLTMFASNTASAALFIPLVQPLAAGIGVDPFVVIMLVGISVSLDFTAPMGTPPNTIAYSTGLVNIRTMARVGLMISLITSLIVAAIALIWLQDVSIIEYFRGIIQQ